MARRRKRRVANPVARRRRRRAAAPARRARRRANPVARRRRRRNVRYSNRIKRGVYKYTSNKGRRRRRNPGVSLGMGSGLGKVIQNSVYVIAGAVATRALSQMVLKEKNTGTMGYVANAIGSVLLGMVASKVFKSKEIGTYITMGGMVGVVLRALQDYTPIGQYVNLQLAGLGLRGDHGMGAIVPTTFFVPLNQADSGGGNIANMSMPGVINALAASATAGAGRGVAGMRGVGTILRGGRYAAGGRYS